MEVCTGEWCGSVQNDITKESSHLSGFPFCLIVFFSLLDDRNIAKVFIWCVLSIFCYGFWSTPMQMWFQTADKLMFGVEEHRSPIFENTWLADSDSRIDFPVWKITKLLILQQWGDYCSTSRWDQWILLVSHASIIWSDRGSPKIKKIWANLLLRNLNFWGSHLILNILFLEISLEVSKPSWHNTEHWSK